MAQEPNVVQNAQPNIDELMNDIKTKMNQIKQMVQEKEANITQLKTEAKNAEYDTQRLTKARDDLSTELKAAQNTLDVYKKSGETIVKLTTKNLELRDSKQTLVNNYGDSMANIDDLLNLFWSMYTQYQLMIDSIHDKLIDAKEEQSLQDVQKLVHETNTEVIKEINDDLENNHVNGDYAIAMAATFNKEAHRLRMKQKFSETFKRPRKPF